MKRIKNVLLAMVIGFATGGNLHSQILTDLHSFAGPPTDGANPSTALVLYNGLFHGVTSSGGANDNGAIFRMSTNGANYELLKSFPAATANSDLLLTNSDGVAPKGLVATGDGVLFGTTSEGGTSGGGVVFALKSDGSGFRVVKEFPSMYDAAAVTDGSRPNAAPALCSGALYGTTLYGGTSGNGVIYKLNTNGSGFSVLKHFSAAGNDPTLGAITNADGMNSFSKLLLHGDWLYGTSDIGGRYGNGTIFKINTNGGGFGVLKHLDALISPGTNISGANPAGVLAISGETLYGTTSQGGPAGNGTVFKVNTDGSGFQVLKSFSENFAHTNLDGAFATWGLIVSGDTLYGVSQNGGAEGWGVLFSLKTNGNNFVVLHNFTMNTKDPSAGLAMLGEDIFGMTRLGGTNNAGLAYRFELPPPSSSTTGALQVVLGPTQAIDAGASWQLDDGAFQTSGTTLTEVLVGNHTLRFKSVSGWSPPADRIIVITADETNSQTGMYTATATGSLQLTINPPAAVTAGAKWSVDGGTLENSGAIVSGLNAGTHSVSFSAVAGWITPPDRGALVTATVTNAVSVTYTQSASLRVTITPAGAITDGAQWQVDGGAFRDSDAVVSDLSPGDHLISFKAIGGWIAPTNILVTVTSGITNTANGDYTASETPGAVQVLIEPAAAITDGARWTLDGTATQHSSGDVVQSVSAGNHTIEFVAISGWIAPSGKIISVSAGSTNIVTGIYTNLPAQTGALRVNITPAGAVAAGAQCQLDGGAFFDSGSLQADLAVGNHTLTFKAVSGWNTPATQLIAITAGATNTVAGAYTAFESTKPKLVITSPGKTGQRWSNQVFTVTGTAKDNSGLAGVLLQINGGDWTNSTTANGWTNWSAVIALTAGNNTIRAYAVDFSGNKSLTNTVSILYVLSDRLIITNSGGTGTFTPNLNNHMLQINNRYTITAKPAKGFALSTWTSNFGLVTNKPALSFLMQSNLVLTANFIDITRPTIAITNVPKGGRVSNALFVVKGAARDNLGVSNVLYSLNGGVWSNALTSNAFTNWNATVELSPGVNSVRAYAIDARGNRSLTNTVSINDVVSDRLVVQTIGQGTLKPDLDGALLAIGARYSMSAKAAKGFAFSGWTTSGGTNSNATLSFVMESNLVLTANFRDITRPANIITIPAVNQKWSNSLFVATGRASDNVGVSNVWYKVGSSDWNEAILAANRTNWTTANWELPAGTNVVQAFAMDFAGNASLTNSVRFTYVVQSSPNWAPASLNGLIAQVTPDGGSSISVGFDPGNFSQTGEGTNREDYSFGSYHYESTNATTPQLALFYASPVPLETESNLVDLVFTSHYSGFFTNAESHDSGAINFLIATNFVPSSLAGRTITAIATDLSETNILKLGTGVTFTKTSPGGDSGSGTYTFARLSPVAGLLALTFTNVADAGLTVYVQTTFTNSSAGVYFMNSYESGMLQDSGAGKFNVK